MKFNKIILSISAILIFALMSFQTTPSAKEIIERSDKNQQGTTNQGEMAMTIIRPTWKRTMTMKTWAKGDDYSLMLITGPARDKGIAHLKRGKEIWNWQPSISRTVKLPPSMMSQSWMGSDFTNDDLVRQSSIVKDYKHKILKTETLEGRKCYKIEMIPHDEAAIVWGKVIIWVDSEDYLQLKTEFYDEDDYLVNTMIGKNIKKWGKRSLPSVMEIIPADKPGHKTIIEYKKMIFDKKIDDNFFTTRNMKRVR